MLAWCDEGTSWRRENYDSRPHRRDKRRPRVFNEASRLVTRTRNWVRASLLSVTSQLISHIFRPFIGGIFSRPQDRWPNVFSHPFWGDNPYFLPCLLTTAFTCLSFVITSLYLEEVCYSQLKSQHLKRV